MYRALIPVYDDMTIAFIPAKVMETLENNLIKLSNTEYSDPFLGKVVWTKVMTNCRCFYYTCGISVWKSNTHPELPGCFEMGE